MSLVVVNKYKEKYDVYIGRGSILGNPFSLKEYTHEEAISYHKYYFIVAISIVPALYDRLYSLSKYDGIKLGCFCKPKECHGDFIKEMADRMSELRTCISHPDQSAKEWVEYNLSLFEGWAIPKNLPKLNIDIDAIASPLQLTNALSEEGIFVDTAIMARICNYDSLCYKQRMLCEIAKDLLDPILSKSVNNKDFTKYLDWIDSNQHQILFSSKIAEERLLSNLAHTPFDHPNFGRFESVEGFWFWYGGGGEEFRNLHGFECKTLGSKIKNRVYKDDFEDQLFICLCFKIFQNDNVLELVRRIDKPLVHYFTYGGKKVWPKSPVFLNMLVKAIYTAG